MYYHKIISKRSTFSYLFIGYFTNLVPLIDYGKKVSYKFQRFQKF
jgi:hypothetical protein